MKRRIGQLIIVVIIFQIIYGPLRVLFQTLDFGKTFGDLTDGHSFSLELSGRFIQVGYAVAAYLVLYYFYDRRNWLKLILSFLIGLAFFVTLRYLIEEQLIFLIFGSGNYFGEIEWHYYFFDNIYFAFLYCALGSVFFFFHHAQYSEARRNALIIETKKTELSFLRSQINPHFLFNSLNNLYSLVYYKSDKALLSLEKLSGLLSYSLYENNEQIKLKNEIKYILDFIELERMRFDYELALLIEIDEEIGNIEIPPFILVPFVENAFKHGDLRQQENPIKIQLTINDGQLMFLVHNGKRAQQKDAVGGIGLQNVKKRLDLIYGESHSLDVIEDEKSFRIELKIKDL